MSVDKPVSPASEVAREWMPVYSVTRLAALIEADREEVRAAALEEWKEQMLQLCEATGELTVNGFCLAMLVRMEAIAAGKTEETPRG